MPCNCNSPWEYSWKLTAVPYRSVCFNSLPLSENNNHSMEQFLALFFFFGGGEDKYTGSIFPLILMPYFSREWSIQTEHRTNTELPEDTGDGSVQPNNQGFFGFLKLLIGKAREGVSLTKQQQLKHMFLLFSRLHPVTILFGIMHTSVEENDCQIVFLS